MTNQHTERAEDKASGEPVAKVMQHEHGGLTVNNLIDTDLPCGTLLYTHPQPQDATPAREWAGLTDFEIASAMTGQPEVGISFQALCNIARAIESALREKNAAPVAPKPQNKEPGT